MAEAIRMGSPMLVRILYSHDPVLDEPAEFASKEYDTYLDIALNAADSPDEETVKCLIELGAKVTEETAKHLLVQTVRAKMSTSAKKIPRQE